MLRKESTGSESVHTDQRPTVSVIIPTYNAAHHIGEALDSVFAQTFVDYEVILINDGSPDTDELERVLDRYTERITYLKHENRGPSGARNTGIERARGKFVALLDSDDVWLPDYLIKQVALLDADPKLDLVYSDALIFGDSTLAGRTFMETAPSHGPVTFESLLRYESSIITSCVVVRRQSLIDAGLFDEKFIRCEDFDVWIRLAHRGGHISYQRQVLVRHRAHGASLAADDIKMVESQIEVLKKAQCTLPLTSAQQDLINQQLASCAAQIDLAQGKRHFIGGDYRQAALMLKRANGFYKSRKLRFVLWALCFAPCTLRSIYRLRQNLAHAGGLRRHAEQK